MNLPQLIGAAAGARGATLNLEEVGINIGVNAGVLAACIFFLWRDLKVGPVAYHKKSYSTLHSLLWEGANACVLLLYHTGQDQQLVLLQELVLCCSCIELYAVCSCHFGRCAVACG